MSLKYQNDIERPSVPEWILINKLCGMHIKRVKSIIIDIEGKEIISDERRTELLKQNNQDLTYLYLLQGKAEINIKSHGAC